MHVNILTTQAPPKTILFVEDEALIALVEHTKLQQHGFHVITADNGAAAVEIALNTPQLDLILMNINLGSGIDGTEAARQILQQREVPIVFISSYTEQEIIEKTNTIPFYGYVVRNFGQTGLFPSIPMALKLFEAHQRLKELEEALRASEARDRRCVEMSPATKTVTA